MSPGDFVVVPLGPMKRIGVVWNAAETPRKPFDPKKLKAVIAKLGEVPPLPPVNLAFADWVANYTLAPRGMVLQMMMSARLVFEAEEPRWGFRFAGEARMRLTDARRKALAVLARRRGLAEEEAHGRGGRERGRHRRAGAGGRAGPRRAAAREAAVSAPGFRLRQPHRAADRGRRSAARDHRRRRLFDDAARRRDGLRQDRGLFRGRGGGAAARPGAGADPLAGNRADDPVPGALRGALRLPPGRVAFRRVAEGAGAHVARRRGRRGARGLRRALGAVPALRRSRPDRGGRGARLLLQAGRPRRLSGARHGGGARLAARSPSCSVPPRRRWKAS